MSRTEEILYLVLSEFYAENPEDRVDERKLMNLMYLLDRESVLNNGQTLTGAVYGRYLYGPHTEEVIRAIEKANERHLFHKIQDRSTQDNSTRYDFCNCPEHEVDVDSTKLTNSEIISDIIDDYGHMSGEELREHVCSLPEVKNTEKYGRINFGENLL